MPNSSSRSGPVPSSSRSDSSKNQESAASSPSTEALSASAVLQALYDQAPMGLAVLDAQLRYVRINERLAEINGLSVAEHLGKTVREVVPDLANTVESIVHHVLKTGEPVVDLEVKGETAAQPGVERVWKSLWTPIYDAQGKAVGINVMAEEVTERKRAEAALQETQTQYRQLFEALNDGFCVCELLLNEEGTPYDYRFLEVNPAFEDHTGLKEAAGKTIYELVPNLEPHWVESYSKVALQGEQVRFEQGSAVMGRWFSVYAFPFGPPHSRQFAVQFRDISARKRAEEALRQSAKKIAQQQKKLLDLFEQAPVAIVVYRGSEHVIELVNPRASELWGVAAAALMNRPLAETLPEVQKQGMRGLLDEILRSGEPFVGNEFPIVFDRDGKSETRYFDFVYQPWRDERDAIIGVIAISIDVSERKQRKAELQRYREQLALTNQELAAINEEMTVTNEELSAANTNLVDTNEQLKRVNADLDNFVYAASHDLKAPISNIKGLLTLLEQHLSPDSLASARTQKVLRMMEASVARFMRTIADLSDVARLQRRDQEPEAMVDVDMVITEVLLDIAPAIKEANAQIDVDVAGCGPIRFAPKHLRSVVYNLLSNAVKYHDPQRPPIIQIRCESETEYQVLTVADNGLGMELADRPLFGLFQRFHSHVEGTGIGLYMVKKIVENAGGTIHVESTVGVGTTFTVRFKR
jgi:PAS domain S-box-containing protein